MTTRFKITSWNVEHLDKLLQAQTPNAVKRRDAVISEIREMDPDLLCLLEGPKGEAAIDSVCSQLLGGDYVAVKSPDGDYGTKGSQWIWFLVKRAHASATSLLPYQTWDSFCGDSWDCFFWGDHAKKRHRHYRHPQVCVLDWQGQRIEFIGLHLKSKFVNGGQAAWKAGGQRRNDFIAAATKARIKLTTEAANVRDYAKFQQVENPAVFVLGDLNDGPGKEYFGSTIYFTT